MAKQIGGKHRLELDYAGTRIRIGSDDGATLAWVEEFLCPAFEAASGGGGYSIAFDADGAAYARLIQQAAAANCALIDCFSNDGYFARFPAWTDSAGITWVHCDEDGAFLRVAAAGTDLQLIVRGNRDRDRLTLMRVVRELATVEQWQRGRWLLHGAAFESAGEAVVVCGPKNAGKTTLLMHALAAGCKLITNDRVVIDRLAAGPVARGMPTIVCVREPTLKFFPGLAKRCARTRFQRAPTISECRTADQMERLPIRIFETLPTLSGPQLCRLLGTTAIASAPLTKVLFPKVQPQARGVELVRLAPDEAAEQLAENILAPCRPMRWPSAFQRLAASAPPTWQRLLDHCRRLANDVACYRCVLGPDAYCAAVPWLQRGGWQLKSLLKKGTGTSRPRQTTEGYGRLLGASPLFQQAA